jgi:PhnB protein
MTHMTDNSSPAPAGSHQLTTFFAVDDAAKALDFYATAFGAETTVRFDGPDGTVAHAEMRLGDSVFQIGDPSPAIGIVGPPETGNAFTMTFWTDDVDGVFARALAAGGTELSPVTDVFSGDRLGTLRDPFGVRWCVARHDRDVTPEEIQAAVAGLGG